MYFFKDLMRLVYMCETNVYFLSAILEALIVIKDRGMGCVQVTHLRLTNSRICAFYAKLNHFEVHLMISLRVLESKVFRVVIKLE